MGQSSGEIDKYECLTGEEILPSSQSQMIEQTKFTYSPLGKAFIKQTKTIKDQRKKTCQSFKSWKTCWTIITFDWGRISKRATE